MVSGAASAAAHAGAPMKDDKKMEEMKAVCKKADPKMDEKMKAKCKAMETKKSNLKAAFVAIERAR